MMESQSSPPTAEDFFHEWELAYVKQFNVRTLTSYFLMQSFCSANPGGMPRRLLRLLPWRDSDILPQNF
jgi:hypothetical protein